MGKRAKKIQQQLDEMNRNYENGDSFDSKAYYRSMCYVYLNHIPDDKLEAVATFMKEQMQPTKRPK